MLVISPTPYELHITTTPLPVDEIPNFQAFCIEHKAKPLLIELDRGEFIEQPMFNKVVYCESLQEALHEATIVSKAMIAKSWETKRLKIEIPASWTEKYSLAGTSHQPYFEWHGKINCEVTTELKELLLLHKVHLSVNALKRTENFRFITLREFGTYADFQLRVADLKRCLEGSEWSIVKDISEYCIYDNNVYLDNGWLPV